MAANRCNHRIPSAARPAMADFRCSWLRRRFLFFPPNAGKSFLARPPFRHHDPIVHLFHRRAPNHRFVSARSRGERDVMEFNRRDFHEVPFDDDYCSGHDQHSDCDFAARRLLWCQVLLRQPLLRQVRAELKSEASAGESPAEVFHTPNA